MFTSRNIDGVGIPVVNQTIPLPTSAASAGISMGGESLILSNLMTNLNLTGQSCADIPYICLTLRRNVLSQPDFRLEAVPQERILTTCQLFACSGRVIYYLSFHHVALCQSLHQHFSSDMQHMSALFLKRKNQ